MNIKLFGYKQSISCLLIASLLLPYGAALAVPTEAQEGGDIAKRALDGFKFPTGTDGNILNPESGTFQYFSKEYKKDAEGNLILDTDGYPILEEQNASVDLFSKEDYESLSGAFQAQDKESQQQFNVSQQENGVDGGGYIMGDTSVYDSLKSSIILNESLFSKTSLQNDPRLNDTRNIFKEIKNNPIFSGCSSNLTYQINDVTEEHVESLRYCRDSLAAKSCKVRREYTVSKAQSCNPGKIIQKKLINLLTYFSWDNKSLLNIDQICSNGEFNLSLYSSGSESCGASTRFIAFNESTPAGTVLSTHCVYNKFYRGWNKYKDRRILSFILTSPVVCDGWRCKASFRLTGPKHRRSKAAPYWDFKDIYLEKQHLKFTMNSKIKDAPPGCSSSNTCRAQDDLTYIGGEPSSTKAWKCTQAENDRVYTFSDTSRVTLNPQNNFLNGIYYNDPKKPSTVKPIFPGDTPSTICYEAEARKYTCDGDSDIVYDYNGNDALTLYDLRNTGLDNCNEYANSNQCMEIDKKTVKTSLQGSPLVYAKKYDCGFPENYGQLQAEETLTCNGPIQCMGEDCVTTSTNLSNGSSFTQAMASASIANSISDTQADCLNIMSVKDVDLEKAYDIYFVFNESDLSNANLGQVPAIETIQNLKYSIKALSIDGTGIPETIFENAFIDASIEANRPGFIKTYLTENPATNYPLIFVANKTNPDKINKLVSDSYATVEMIESSVSELHSTSEYLFDEPCSQAPKIFKGKLYECKKSSLGIKKIDCCKPGEVGVTPNIQMYYQTYKIGKKLDEAFKLTQMASEWITTAFPETTQAISDLASNVSNLFTTSTTTSATATTAATTTGSSAAAASGNEAASAGVSQTITNYAAQGVGELFGSAAKDSLFSATNAAGETVAASSSEAASFTFTPPPFLVYAYYAYLIYKAVMLLLDLFFGCDDKDTEATRKRENLQCAPTYSDNSRAKPTNRYCSNKDFTGNCLTRVYAQCCFDSPIVAVLHEEIKRIAGIGPNTGGINPSYGSGKNLDCSGFTPEQLQGIDWSLLNDKKIINRLVAVGQIKNPETASAQELREFINNRYSISKMTRKNVLNADMIASINESRQKNKNEALSYMNTLQKQMDDISIEITKEKNKRAVEQKKYNSLTALQKNSEVGLAIQEKIQEFNRTIEQYTTEKLKIEKNLILLKEDIKINPSYQVISIDAQNYTELGDMPKKFGGENVTEQINTLKNDQRKGALSIIN